MSRDLIPQNELLFPPYLFHPTAFETFLEGRLEYLFRNALNLEEESLDLKVIVPSKEEARLCLQTNRTLRAKLEIRWSGSKEVCSLSFPYPAFGVFILRSETSKDGRAGRWVWHPRLVGIPSLWALRKHSFCHGNKKTNNYLRLVLSEGRHLDYLLSGKNKQIFCPSSFIVPEAYSNKAGGNYDALSEITGLFSSPFVRFSNKKERNKASDLQMDVPLFSSQCQISIILFWICEHSARCPFDIPFRQISFSIERQGLQDRVLNI